MPQCLDAAANLIMQFCEAFNLKRDLIDSWSGVRLLGGGSFRMFRTSSALPARGTPERTQIIPNTVVEGLIRIAGELDSPLGAPFRSTISRAPRPRCRRPSAPATGSSSTRTNHVAYLTYGETEMPRLETDIVPSWLDKNPDKSSIRSLQDRAAYVACTGTWPSHLRGAFNLLLRASVRRRDNLASTLPHEGSLELRPEIADRLAISDHAMVKKVRRLKLAGWAVLRLQSKGRASYQCVYLVRATSGKPDFITVYINGSTIEGRLQTPSGKLVVVSPLLFVRHRERRKMSLSL